jgi:hypothetical protein
MSKAVFYTIIIVLTGAGAASGQELFNCKAERNTTIVWDEGGLISRSGLKAGTGEFKNGESVILSIGDQTSTIKGNVGQATVVNLNPTTFLEQTGLGAIFIWKFIPASEGRPPLLFHAKPYDILGEPIAVMSAYICE